MYDAKFNAKVKRLLTELGKVAAVVKALHGEGYNTSIATVRKIKKEFFPDEKTFREERRDYISDLALYNSAFEKFEEGLIVEYLKQKKQFLDDLKGNKIHSQDIIALTNLNRELKKLKDEKEGKITRENDAVQEVVDFFINHQVIGKALEPYRELILENIEIILGRRN